MMVRLDCFGTYAQNVERLDINVGDAIIVSNPRVINKIWKRGEVLSFRVYYAEIKLSD